jgi:two-component system, OmpR family, sensor histidine kinase VicK
MTLRLTIRAKLFLFILLAILVSFSILLFLTIRNIEVTLEEKISRDLETNLRFVRSQLFTGANQLKYALLLPAQRPQVKQDLAKRRQAELGDVLNSIHSSLPFLRFSAFVDRDGIVLARFDSEKIGDRFPLADLAATAFKKREPVLSCEQTPAAFLCGDNEQCRREHADAVTLFAAVAYPISSASGEILGALLAGVPITRDALFAYQPSDTFGHDLEVAITDEHLKIVGESQEEFSIPAASSTVIISRLAQGKTFRGEVRINDTIYTSAFEPIFNSRGILIGSLSVALSKTHFDALRQEYLGGIAIAALIGTFLSLLIAYLASRHVAVPLKELARGVQCIESGNLDYRVAIDENDEFGSLAQSFNRMADSLRERDATIKYKTFDLEMLNRCLHEMNELLESNVKERTTELEMEKNRLEAILASLAEGIVVTDREHRVILLNAAAQKIFGVAPYKVVGCKLEDLEVKGGLPLLVPFILAMSSGDHLAVGEKELDTSKAKLRIALSPLLDRSWEFAGVVTSIRDVTHEEAVDRMKTEFISTVSHELKTPLTSMKGSLQLILGRGEGLSEMERELIRVCLRNTDRLIRLISDILDISKIESGRVALSLKSEPVERLIRYSMEEIAGFARDHNVTVVYAGDGHVPPMLGDYDRLIQVLTNLLSNAVKFSPAGKTVTVSARREGDFVSISIHDEGTVIERDDRERLFQKFPQLKGAEAGERGGSGLGLAICKEIVELHHGKIYYQAGKGGGNSFTFTVPVSGRYA